MDIPTIHPRAMQKGDTIAIVAPAGPIEKRSGLQQGIASLERMGFRVRFEERIFQSNRYLAGDDDARAEELMRAFEDPAIRAIIALRGGYGCARLIPLLQEKRLRPHPKIFMGYSDLTTLHLFFRRRFGWITFHGPMATSPALGSISVDQERHVLSMWTNPSYRPELQFSQFETWMPGSAEGVLIGGCLSIIVASLGTPYEIKTEGKILFLEDQGEPPYRLDRMLMHLHLAGKLENLAGILLGSFYDCEPDQGGYSCKDVLKDILGKIGVPVLAGFPAGHGEDNWAIPLGLRVRLDANARSLTMLESPVL
jgi:muramoyltetrapeptide carboxypeptidase